MKNSLKKDWSKARMEEAIFKVFMLAGFGIVCAALLGILVNILIKGLPALNWQILTQLPQGGYYLGKEGGILNAIVGSIYLAVGATILSLVIALPIVFGLHYYARSSRWSVWARLFLNVMWGIPTIVYGAFGFMLMMLISMRASLLAGIITLTVVELPILVLTIEESLRIVPIEIEQAAFAVGSTRLEVAFKVIPRQIIPGMVTAILLGFGRVIGDAASVLFTAGYTDRLPESLLDPVASLPLAVFFQLNTPYPEVQKRAYAAALVLTAIVLFASLGSRWLSQRVSKYTIK